MKIRKKLKLLGLKICQVNIKKSFFYLLFSEFTLKLELDIFTRSTINRTYLIIWLRSLRLDVLATSTIIKPALIIILLIVEIGSRSTTIIVAQTEQRRYLLTKIKFYSISFYLATDNST